MSQLNVKVSFPIFLIGGFSFISWVLFSIFGGIGLAALPLDFIYYFTTKPEKLSRDQIQTNKNNLLADVEKIKGLAKDAQLLEQRNVRDQYCKKIFYLVFSKEKREYNDIMKKLRASVNLLDDEYKMIEMQEKQQDEWVLSYYISLFVGIICLLFTLSWLTQILVFLVIKPNGVPLHGLLNTLLVYLQDNGVGFVSTLIFSTFCLYLFWCSIKGNLKFGLRLLLCMEIHPMK
jgi:LMBR1 domain-containing protein 1